MSEFDNILKKLSDIRARAERGGTLAEAEVAAAMMNKLLLKHNLTLADVERYAEGTKRVVERDKIPSDTAMWKANLMWTVADAHMCKMVRHPGHRYGRGAILEVFGHSHNLIVVRETYLWLLDVINRLADEAHERALENWDYEAEESPRAWKNSFRTGATFGVSAAYRAMRAELKAEVGNAWALVPVLEAEVQQAMDLAYPKLSSGGKLHIANKSAFSQGKQAGQAINVGSRQVGGRSGAKALAG
jgi:hypothetical protein